MKVKEMKVRKSSLAINFVVIVLAMLIIGQGLLWIWFLSSFKERTGLGLVEKSQNSAYLLASFTAKAVADNDFSDFDRQIEAALRDEDIISIKIYDKTGKVLKEKVSRSEDHESSGWSLFFLPPTGTIKVQVKSDTDVIGLLEMVYSAKKANSEIKRLMKGPPLAQAIVFMFSVYGLFFFFDRKIGRPLDVLQSSIKKVTDGDLTTKMPEMGDNEMANIARGLGFLVDGLSSTVSKLHTTANNVEIAIKQLHLTFENVITKGVQQQYGSLDNISLSLKKANESQKSISDNTEKLSGFTAENVTSLLQMKTIADEMASSANRLLIASESSYSSVAEMSQTAKVMADNAERVLTSVEDSIASVEELSVSVKEVENGAKESTALANDVRTIAAEKGILAVTEAVEGIERIAEKVKYSVDIVRRLGARSNDIEKMLSVIKEVTEQTNLLSLNAAILATQAGEYGKGFSVVADEIRALSDRTAASTKEITSIVRTLQSEISDVVMSIESGMVLVEDGSALVYKAGESIGSILEAAQKSARMASAIEKATEEQAKGLRQIGISGEDIRKLASQMAKATTEQSKSSEYMLERIGEVKEIAESTKMGTEEQAMGMKIISKNLEMANERIGEISGSVVNQQKVNEGIIMHLEQIRNIGNATVRDIDSITLSLGTLEDEINNLKKEMEAFRIT